MLTVSEPDAPCGAVCCLRRDFKGDNVLIREADGWPFLTDFGSGHFLGATPLTEPPFPPGTPYYRAPEAWRFVHLAQQQPAVPYSPTAPDDVFALGVTAYRLLTGEYPSLPDSAFRDLPRDEAAPPSPCALNPRCIGELSGLTARMLSPSPEARGTAHELAEAMERAAREAGPEADEPLFEREAPEPGLPRSGPTLAVPRFDREAPEPSLMQPGSPRFVPRFEREAPEPSLTRSVEVIHKSAHTRPASRSGREPPEPALTRSGPTHDAPLGLARAVRSRLTAASLGAALAMSATWMLSAHPGVKAEKAHASRPEETRDGGTIAVGDTALTAPAPLSQAPFAWSTVAVDVPPKPLPGQRRPDAKGRCPNKTLVPINGGCWIKMDVTLKDCEELGYVYKGDCYTPFFPRPRPPTSSPVKHPDNTPE